MSTILSFPQEITELIVDALAVEGRPFSSVKSLSLVCRGLLPHCRKHIFAYISLTDSNSKRALQKLTSLWELLKVTPELGPHIRTIIYALDGWGYDETPNDLSAPLVVSQRLTKLKSLHLISYGLFFDSFRWKQTHRHALLPLLLLPTLTYLKLDQIHDLLLSDLIPASSLKDLHIKGVIFEEQPAGTPMDAHKSIPITHFSMRDVDSESVRVLVGGTQRPDGRPIMDVAILKTLCIRLQDGQELVEMTEFFGRGRALVEVELIFDKLSPVLDGLFDILAGSLKTLKNLKFSIPISEHSVGEGSIPMLSRELGKLSGLNAVESIKIVLYTFFLPKFKRGDEWAPLDDTLSRGGWPALKYVSLVAMVGLTELIEHPKYEEGLVKLPETQFVGLATSSTIQFDFEIKYH